jgi:hypothetical protein
LSRNHMPHFCGSMHSLRTRLGPAEPDAGSREWRRPTHEEIARLAYSYWDARGCWGGSPLEDWFRAERVLTSHDS